MIFELVFHYCNRSYHIDVLNTIMCEYNILMYQFHLTYKYLFFILLTLNSDTDIALNSNVIKDSKEVQIYVNYSVFDRNI